MEGFEMPIDWLVHDKRALTIDDVTAAVLLVTAQDMGMLHNHGVCAHLDHEMAGVLDARAGHQKLVSTVKQHNEVIEVLTVAVHVSHEVNQIQRIRAPAPV